MQNADCPSSLSHVIIVPVYMSCMYNYCSIDPIKSFLINKNLIVTVKCPRTTSSNRWSSMNIFELQNKSVSHRLCLIFCSLCERVKRCFQCIWPNRCHSFTHVHWLSSFFEDRVCNLCCHASSSNRKVKRTIYFGGRNRILLKSVK